MVQSLASILVHIVFSTKERRSLIKPEIETELHAYMVALFKDSDCVPLVIGGTDNHVHVLCHLGKSFSASNVIENVKKKSSKWIKTKGPAYADFYWQGGYGIFSIGNSQAPTLRTYIQNQKKHHEKKSFQDEFLDLLQKYGIEYDERYLWK